MKSFFSLFLILSSLVAVTGQPTDAPTAAPTAAPTDAPTRAPTASPTFAPTRTPTASPTLYPTVFVPNPGHPACSICGVDYRIGKRDGVLVLPGGQGTYTCSQFEQIGFDGFIDPNSCTEQLTTFVGAFCDCITLDSGPYCNICGVLGNVTNPSGLVVRDGLSTISCGFYSELGANGRISLEQCDVTSASFLAANAQCGCQAPPSGFAACPVCPTNFTLADKQSTFTFEGQGLAPLSCGDYEKAGANGLISPTICAAATTSARAACGGCVDVPGPFDPCNACGDQFFQNPSSTAPITLDNATSAITCAEWAKSTSLGFVTPDICEINVNITKAACGCTVDPPTPAPTEAPTSAPTSAPTDSPVVPPTDSPIAPPTDSPIEPPIAPPTDSPTAAPVNTPQPVLAASAKPTVKKAKKMKKMMMRKKKKKDLKPVPVV